MNNRRASLALSALIFGQAALVLAGVAAAVVRHHEAAPALVSLADTATIVQ